MESNKLKRFEHELKERTSDLESDRKVIRNLYYIGLFCVCLIGLFTMTFFKKNEDITLVILLLMATTMVLFHKFITKKYRFSYKKRVINKIFDFFIDECAYNPAGSISPKHIRSSGLPIGPFEGHDYVKGSINGYPIEFCEITSYNKASIVAISGLFFVIDFNKSVSSPILILNDKFEKKWGKQIVDFMYAKKWNKMEMVKLESSDFEKRFIVYAKDQLESRLILNPKTIDKLNSFFKNYKQEISLSLFEDKIYLYLSGDKFFEPNLVTKTVKWSDIVLVYNIFQLLSFFIKEINFDEFQSHVTKIKEQQHG